MHDPPVVQAALSARAEVSHRRLTITLYSVAAFLYWAGLYLYMPTLPSYVQSKAENLALVGVVLSMYGLWQAAIRLPLGIAADWLGQRKPFILVGLILVGLGAWMLGTAQSVTGLAIGRAVTGLAAGTWVPLIVVFSSLFPPQEAVRATAILSLIGSAGRVLATAATGSLNQMGGYSLAFFLATGAAALAILVLLPSQEMPRPSQRPSVSGISQLITRRDVLLPSLLAAMSQYANWATTFGFMPILARQMGGTDVAQSMLVSMHLALVILGNLLTTAMVGRVGARRLIYISFVLLAIGIGGVALANRLPWLFVSQLCIGLSLGISYPTLMGMSIRYVTDSERTTAMGLHQAMYAVGMFGGPWVSGWLADLIGIRFTFGATAVLCLALAPLANHWLKRNPIDQSDHVMLDG